MWAGLWETEGEDLPTTDAVPGILGCVTRDGRLSSSEDTVSLLPDCDCGCAVTS